MNHKKEKQAPITSSRRFFQGSIFSMEPFLNNKKAQTMAKVVSLIALLIAFFSIFMFTNEAYAKVNGKGEEALCRNSIIFRANSAINLGDNKVQLAPNQCKTLERKIKGDRKEIKQQLGDLMARCWWMFSEGRYDEALEGPKDAINVFGIQNKCFVCYQAFIDDEVDGGDIGAEELNRFLTHEKYKKKKDFTYLEYIQSFEGAGKVAILDSVKSKNAYAITFMPKTHEELTIGWDDAIAAAALTAGVVGATVCLASVVCGGVILTSVGAGALAASGTALGVAGGVGATAAGTVGIAGATYLEGQGFRAYRNFVGKIYEADRDVSIIGLDNLASAQDNGCIIKEVVEG